jgi:hypothetical protein
MILFRRSRRRSRSRSSSRERSKKKYVLPSPPSKYLNTYLDHLIVEVVVVKVLPDASIGIVY